MPYWIAETLATTPAFVWVYAVVGGLLAWAILPPVARSGRARWLILVGLAPMLGAFALTLIVFALGTFGLLTHGAIQGLLIATAGGSLLTIWVRRQRATGIRETASSRLRFAWDERLLLILIVGAWVVRWFVIAYWPFTAYDTLWVYGFEGKLLALSGGIPHDLNYYPPFMAAQYAYGQIALGTISDHVARAGLPILHLASVGAVYTLGAQIRSRKVGLYAAAIWSLYPHVGEWSRAGDLEIALAAWAALFAAFFLSAWFSRAQSDEQPRPVWNAALAGVMLAGGLWTKPTMGAFVWGVLLLCALELALQGGGARGGVRVRIQAAWPRLRVAGVTLLMGGALGGLWYGRNVLFGHAPITFPGGFWQTQAMQSGAEFGWPLLALILVLLYVAVRSPRQSFKRQLLLPGLLLIALGVTRTILEPGRMSLLEYIALLVGIGLTLWALLTHPGVSDPLNRLCRNLAEFGWVYALALPYFLTWFWSYSYHYRLSFAIVPLLIVPIAYSVPYLLRKLPRALHMALLVVLAIPGIVSPVYDPYVGSDYLFNGELPDDDARYRSGNPALMNVVDGLRVWQTEHPGQTLTVAAPGIQALPFFFPMERIRTTDVPLRQAQNPAPTRLAEVEDVTYFIYGAPESDGVYADVPVLQNQVVASLGRADVFRRAWGMDDGIFRYDVFEPMVANRFIAPQPNAPAQGDVVVNSPQTGRPFARFLGSDIGGLDFWPGRRVVLHLYWQVLETPPDDLTTLVHLRSAEGELLATWDGPVAPYLNSAGEPVYYSTHLWDVDPTRGGEFINDERILELPPDVPLQQGASLVIGFYDLATGERAPLFINGARAEDGSYTVDNRLNIIPPPAE